MPATSPACRVACKRLLLVKTCSMGRDLSITTTVANPSLKKGLKCSLTPVPKAGPIEGTPLLRLFLPRPGFTRYLMQRSQVIATHKLPHSLPGTLLRPEGP